MTRRTDQTLPADADDVPPLIFRKNETMTLKEAITRAEKNRKTVIELARRHKIFRQLSPSGPIEIHRIGLEAVLSGDMTALALLRSDERAHPRVVRYYDAAGIPT